MTAEHLGRAKLEISQDKLESFLRDRSKIHAAIGKITLTMMASTHCHGISVGTLIGYVLEPLARDRLVIAHAATNKSGSEQEVIGVVIWANVSDEVAKQLELQSEQKNYPLVLTADQWDSGDNIWMLGSVEIHFELMTAEQR